MPGQPWAVTWRKALVSAPRLVPDAVLRFTSPEGPQPFVVRVPSRGKHQIPLYIFVPPSSESSTISASNSRLISLPVLVDFHGGGFVLGACHEQAPFCAKLCRELNCVAISVDYRLGPYAQFPAALEDAEDVLNAILKPQAPGYTEIRYGIAQYLRRNSRREVRLDTSRIALSGFSSGGNLALNLVMNMGPPAVPEPWPCPFPSDYTNEIPVLLFYAALDCRKLPSEREIVAGFHEVPKNIIASLELESYLMPTYLPRDQTMHHRASPGMASIKDTLHQQARCLLILAEQDSLSLQNEDWATRAIEEERGYQVRLEKYIGVPHGWTQFPSSWLDSNGLNNKVEAYDRATEFARELWERGRKTKRVSVRDATQ